MKHLKSFEEFGNVNEAKTRNTAMTVKKLKADLELLLSEGEINEDDLVFFHTAEEDEGSLNSLRAIAMISAPHIQVMKEQSAELKKLKNQEGVSIAFVSPNPRKV